MAKTRLTVIRHGETEWNVARRLQGQNDSMLTRNGIIQAEKVSRFLVGQNFDILISSDLSRAIKTAEIINKRLKIPKETHPGLRERNFGIMEGLTREEIQEKFPGVFESYLERKDSYIVPEGESLEVFYKRVTDTMQEIAALNAGKEILIVTHGGVLDCMMRLVFDYPLSSPRRFSIYNASVNIFTINDDGWFLEQWGYMPDQDMNSISLDELKK